MNIKLSSFSNFIFLSDPPLEFGLDMLDYDSKSLDELYFFLLLVKDLLI